MVNSTPRPQSTPGKDPVPILQEAGWAPGLVWTGGKSRPNRNSIPDRPARRSVAIPTELPGPLYEMVQKGNAVHVTSLFLAATRISRCAFDRCLQVLHRDRSSRYLVLTRTVRKFRRLCRTQPRLAHEPSASETSDSLHCGEKRYSLPVSP